MNISVVFSGYAGDTRDVQCHNIFKTYKGDLNRGGGTMFGSPPKRDLEFNVPERHAEACLIALKNAGFDPKQC